MYLSSTKRDGLPVLYCVRHSYLCNYRHIRHVFCTNETYILLFFVILPTVINAKTDMSYHQFFLFGYFFLWTVSISGQRYWTAAEGLPTGEVRQIIELPNGQMLVNCEGVFCLSNGRSFDIVPCDQSRSYNLPQYVNSYGQMWQGDSLLWLHDMYRIYLFDVRSRTFVYDIGHRLRDEAVKDFVVGGTVTSGPSDDQLRVIDSLRVRDVTMVTADRQGGTWIGTRTNGIVYQPPQRSKPEILTGEHPLIGIARSAVDSAGRIWRYRGYGLDCEYQGHTTHYDQSNVRMLPHGRITFIEQLTDGRYLLCDSLCLLGYFLPERHEYISLNEKLPALRRYRYFVGACSINEQWTAVYTQNGMFMLDVRADTLAPWPYAKDIERYSSKYNCMLKDRRGRLWIGTQNGLFYISHEGKAIRVGELTNNCIRSLVADAGGEVWAGTSCGISRITPTVVNFSAADGVPAVAMMDRAACLTGDGRLVFAIGGATAVSFRPDELVVDNSPHTVVITGIMVNGQSVCDASPFLLSYRENNLSLQFSTLNYAVPSHDRYRYRLRGHEEMWNLCNDGSGQATAVYTSLSPGHYVFEVQAAVASGEWGPMTELVFVINPPLWLTWWAKMLYVILVFAAGCWLILFYLKRKKAKLERENEDKVNRLFELREEARHQFAESANISPDKITVNAEEEKLVGQMLAAIEAHIDEENYNADLLAHDVAMSRASLYKKLQAMLGITPTDFIRNVRLKRAVLLLADTQLTISEIAVRVGFATPRNFSTQFKKMFGVLPSEYRVPKGKTNK